MTQGYRGQFGLLLEVLRIAAKPEVFALKEAAAINFFFQDCPRLSVDIDLCYLPLSGRDEAFRIKFAKNLKRYPVPSEAKGTLWGTYVHKRRVFGVGGECKKFLS